MRISFIILAHKAPDQVLRLLQRLRHPQVDCYIHLDAKCNFNEWAPIAALPQVYFVEKRVAVTWAAFSQTQAILNSMAAVLKAGQAYRYISLISGQDYPLKNIDAFYRFLLSQDGRQFLEVWPPDELAENMTKITRYHFEDLRLPGKYRLTGWLNKLAPQRRHPLNMKAYIGSTWWSLTEDCAAYCLRFLQEHPALKRFYRYTWGSDEFLFHTIIMNSAYKEKVVNDNLHYIDWSEDQASPKTFRADDLPALLQSGKFFARKLDLALAPELLDRIDELITPSSTKY
jgi:hypothetical protein